VNTADKHDLIRVLKSFQADVHYTAVDKGFWTDPNDGEKIALMHSELSECLDYVRNGNPASDHIPEFSGAEEELADTIIRILDYAGHKRFRVAEALLAKAAFNECRPFKHGKAF